METLCINCQNANREDAEFCEKCGDPLRRRCPACGEKNWVGAETCGNCGQPLDILEYLYQRHSHNTAEILNQARQEARVIKEQEAQAAARRSEGLWREERIRQEAVAAAAARQAAHDLGHHAPGVYRHCCLRRRSAYRHRSDRHALDSGPSFQASSKCAWNSMSTGCCQLRLSFHALRSMPYSVALPVFNGPLDLLLQLVEREELEITAVSLTQVTDQFLETVRSLETLQLPDIADFLVVAARLIYIKSQALLPRPPSLASTEEDAGEELARQLIAYRKYKEIAGLLHQREAEGLRTYLRVAAPPKVEPRLDLSNVRAEDLLLAVQRALAAQPDGPPVSSVVVPPKITIRDQIWLIGRQLRAEGRVSFYALLGTATSRVEIVVTFLAILELIKQRRVQAIQEQTFGNIELRVVGEWNEMEDFEFEFAE